MNLDFALDFKISLASASPYDDTFQNGAARAAFGGYQRAERMQNVFFCVPLLRSK